MVFVTGFYIKMKQEKEKEIVALRLGTLGPFNLHSFFWRCA
jgi:hypothetical protein